jgi:hypothetical protein
MRWTEHVACVREAINAYRILVEKSTGRRPLRRLRPTWEDNIKMDYIETIWKVVDWFNLAQDTGRWHAFVHTVMNLRVPTPDQLSDYEVLENKSFPRSNFS